MYINKMEEKLFDPVNMYNFPQQPNVGFSRDYLEKTIKNDINNGKKFLKKND